MVSENCWFYCSQTLLNYLAFKSSDFKCSWIKAIPEICCETEFSIYVFIKTKFAISE